MEAAAAADMEVGIVVVAAAAAVAEVAEVSSTSFYPMMGLTKVVVGKGFTSSNSAPLGGNRRW
jgi:hypothetical protein